MAGAKTFGLLKARGLTFIPIKVRLLLFRHIIYLFIYFFLSLLCEKKKGKGKVSSVRYGQRVLIGGVPSITVSVHQGSIKVLR